MLADPEPGLAEMRRSVLFFFGASKFSGWVFLFFFGERAYVKPHAVFA
jgi:hypothetical protein